MTSTKRIAATVIAILAIGPSAAQAASLPPITPLKPLVVKWILPPRSSSMYEAEKAWAQANGIPTVEFDDPSYPGPR